jgi:hypothetical protein
VDLYAWPEMYHRIVGHPLPALVAALPAAVVLAASALPLFLADRSARLRAAVVAICLCVLTHYLAYYAVFEYQYTTLLPLLPAQVWLYQREEAADRRRLLMISFAISLFIFLPTLNFLSLDDPERYWLPNSVLRVFPVGIAFLCLARYAVAVGWSQWKQGAVDEETGAVCSAEKGTGTICRNGPKGASHQWWQSHFPPIAGQVRSIFRPAAFTGAILGLVLLAAFATSPARIWKLPHHWTRLDWIDHCEDMVQRGGVWWKLRGLIHRQLARCYMPLDIDRALEYYALSVYDRHDPDYAIEMGDALIRCGRYAEAQQCFAEIAQADPENPAVQRRLKAVDRLLAQHKAM